MLLRFFCKFLKSFVRGACVCVMYTYDMYVSVGTHVPRHTCGSQTLDGSSSSTMCDVSSTALVTVYTKLAGL